MGVYHGRYRVFNELKIKGPNGKDIDPEEEKNKDYTDEKDNADDDQTGAPDEAGTEEPTDYTKDTPEGEEDTTEGETEEPVEGETEEPTDGETEEPADGEEDTTDYTIPDDDEVDTPPEGEEGTTDYTGETPEGEEGSITDEEPVEGETPEGEEPTDGGAIPDTTDDGTGGAEGGDGAVDYTGEAPEDGEEGDGTEGGELPPDEANELKELETQLFSNLTPEQLNIKHIELKTQFIDLYETVDKTINRINKITKNEDNLKVLEFTITKLIELKDLINFNLTKTYATKSYLENETDFQHCLAIFNTISKILEELAAKKEVINPNV